MTETKPTVKYVEPSELASWLRSGKGKIAIIDVRDADYPYGNIKGCVNIPSAQFHGDAEAHVANYRSVDRVVFHCAMSQVRGPKAANRFKNVLVEVLETEGETQGPVPEIYVLRGGFSRFQEEFGDSKDLVENLTQEAKDAWKNGWI